MKLSRRRIRAIVVNELRSYRRNRSIVWAMGIIPFIFLVQPVVSALNTSSAAAIALEHHHELLYMLAIPALVPTTLAAYAIVGERQQGTLEPLLTTPVRRQELMLGKALAVFAPSLVVSYAVFALFVVIVELFARAAVAPALLRSSDVIAQIVFTPLLAGWSIWLGLSISTRASEVRVAQQLGVLASLPTIAITTLISINVIHPSLRLAIVLFVALLIANRVGWRMVSALFHRERLIAGVK